MGDVSPAGWYPDPSGVAGQRYFDGQQWTDQFAPQQQVMPSALVVDGPNHVLHAILTFFTWPLCGGWAWIWLIVALNNKKRIRVVR